MKMAVFWVVAPCSMVEVYQRFRSACCVLAAIRTMSLAEVQRQLRLIKMMTTRLTVPANQVRDTKKLHG
jgi:hypothetical protein